MKVGILAGGKGTRLAEETQVRPKPMVEIGGRPILWHIMRHYAHYGHREFAIALGYKGDIIKKYMVESAAVHGESERQHAQRRGHARTRPTPRTGMSTSSTPATRR